MHLFLFKRQIRDALWKKLEGYSWSTAVKERIKQLTIDVETCREHLGAIDVEVIGFQERSSWPESADALLLAIESVVYGYKKDDALVSCLKNRKGIEDTLAHADIKPLVTSIDTKYAKEQGVQEESADEEGEDDAVAKDGDGAEPVPRFACKLIERQGLKTNRIDCFSEFPPDPGTAASGLQPQCRGDVPAEHGQRNRVIDVGGSRQGRGGHETGRMPCEGPLQAYPREGEQRRHRG